MNTIHNTYFMTCLQQAEESGKSDQWMGKRYFGRPPPGCSEGAGWIQAERDNRGGGYSMKIVWLRFEPTEIREIGVRVSSLIRRRYLRAFSGSSSKERADWVLVSQPGWLS